MVEQSKADLVMMFKDKNGGAVWAESMLDVSDGDTLMTDFCPASSADVYSTFFEVKSFSFSMAADPEDDKVGTLSRKAAAPAAASKPAAGKKPFDRWRSAKKSEFRNIHYPVEFNVFSFTRLLDAASMPFFNNCCNSVSFKSAALVKRYSVGSAGDDQMRPMAFLRFDFRDILLTGVNWSDGDLVSEECKFVCRAMCVRYKQQDQAGYLPVLSSGRAVWPNRAPGDETPIDPQVQLYLAEMAFYA